MTAFQGLPLTYSVLVLLLMNVCEGFQMESPLLNSGGNDRSEGLSLEELTTSAKNTDENSDVGLLGSVSDAVSVTSETVLNSPRSLDLASMSEPTSPSVHTPNSSFQPDGQDDVVVTVLRTSSAHCLSVRRFISWWLGMVHKNDTHTEIPVKRHDVYETTQTDENGLKTTFVVCATAANETFYSGLGAKLGLQRRSAVPEAGGAGELDKNTDAWWSADTRNEVAEGKALCAKLLQSTETRNVAVDMEKFHIFKRILQISEETTSADFHRVYKDPEMAESFSELLQWEKKTEKVPVQNFTILPQADEMEKAMARYLLVHDYNAFVEGKMRMLTLSPKLDVNQVQSIEERISLFMAYVHNEKTHQNTSVVRFDVFKVGRTYIFCEDLGYSRQHSKDRNTSNPFGVFWNLVKEFGIIELTQLTRSVYDEFKAHDGATGVWWDRSWNLGSVYDEFKAHDGATGVWWDRSWNLGSWFKTQKGYIQWTAWTNWKDELRNFYRRDFDTADVQRDFGRRDGPIHEFYILYNDMERLYLELAVGLEVQQGVPKMLARYLVGTIKESRALGAVLRPEFHESEYLAVPALQQDDVKAVTVQKTHTDKATELPVAIIEKQHAKDRAAMIAIFLKLPSIDIASLSVLMEKLPANAMSPSIIGDFLKYSGVVESRSLLVETVGLHQRSTQQRNDFSQQRDSIAQNIAQINLPNALNDVSRTTYWTFSGPRGKASTIKKTVENLKSSVEKLRQCVEATPDPAYPPLDSRIDGGSVDGLASLSAAIEESDEEEGLHYSGMDTSNLLIQYLQLRERFIARRDAFVKQLTSIGESYESLIQEIDDVSNTKRLRRTTKGPREKASLIDVDSLLQQIKVISEDVKGTL